MPAAEPSARPEPSPHPRLAAARDHRDLLASHGWSLGLDHPDAPLAQSLAVIAEGPDPVGFHRRFLAWRASRPPFPAMTTQAAMTARFTADWLAYVGLDTARTSE